MYPDALSLAVAIVGDYAKSIGLTPGWWDVTIRRLIKGDGWMVTATQSTIILDKWMVAA